MDLIGWIQLIPLIAAAGSVLFESKYDRGDEDSAKRTTVRIIALLAITCAIIGIVYGRRQSQSEQVRRDSMLQQQLETQRQQLSVSGQIQSEQVRQISKADELAQAQTGVIEGQDKLLEVSDKLRTEQSKGIQE